MLVAFAVSLVLSSCSPPKYRYVTNAEAKTYLKVPRTWKSFTAAQVFDAEASAVTNLGGQPPPSPLDRTRELNAQWRRFFDSDLEPKPEHALLLNSAPTVDIRVRTLDQANRDKVNTAALRNLVIDYDDQKKKAEDAKSLRPLGGAETLQTFEVLAEGEVQHSGGVHGVQNIFRIRGNDNVAYVFNQIALVDASNSRIYLLIIRAGEKEYFDNQGELNKIAQSFTVKQKA